jgi:hypothetical protein
VEVVVREWGAGELVLGVAEGVEVVVRGWVP